MKKTCQECGKEYEASHSNQKFCSVLCYRINVAKTMREYEESIIYIINKEKINETLGENKNGKKIQ